ncbi:ParA family protein [Streptomyces sp. NPDC059679]|uniref:ParA family protein n=1 Tax=Streptomyces sp. NPDC059679 TaxID=3346903 RepID=UPI0036948559
MGKGKGGAGCTVGVLELAYAATQRRRGRRRRRVAVIDLDPQGDATAVLEPASRRRGIKDALTPHQPLPLSEVLVPTAWEGVLVAPADRYLANRESDLTVHAMATLLRARKSGELDELVDDVVIDLPRNIGKLATAGLLGIEHLFITSRATVWAAQGAEEMRYTAERIREKRNPDLKIPGIIVAEYDESRDSRRVLESMQSNFSKFGIPVFDPVPRRVRVREAIESYHTPCRDFGAPELEEVADMYQSFYDHVLTQEGAR